MANAYQLTLLGTERERERGREGGRGGGGGGGGGEIF